MGLPVPKNAEIVPVDGDVSIEQQELNSLVMTITPRELHFCVVLFGLSRKCPLEEMSLTVEKMTMADCKKSTGWPETSHIDQDPKIRRVVELLIRGVRLDLSEQINLWQQFGRERAVRRVVEIVCDDDADKALQFKAAEAIQDRDSTGQTVKRKVQLVGNSPDNGGAVGAKFLEACARRKAIEGTATRETVEFRIGAGEQESEECLISPK